jgi:hypothetical protein
MLLGASTVLAAAIRILGGPVDWFAVVPPAVGLFAGSSGGPIIARHARAHLLRLAVGALGLSWRWNSGCTPHDLTCAGDGDLLAAPLIALVAPTGFEPALPP